MNVTQQPRRSRGQRWKALAVIGAALTVGTACQGATNELQPKQEGLAVANRPTLGKVLVDDEGRTVYLFAKDEARDSYCTGACASVWPPVTSKGIPMVANGLDASKVTLVRRDDGVMQVAYAGHPLYYYQADTSRDDAYGQELDQFGAEWYALTPSGGQAETTTANSHHSSGGNNGSGGGYG